MKKDDKREGVDCGTLPISMSQLLLVLNTLVDNIEKHNPALDVHFEPILDIVVAEAKARVPPEQVADLLGALFIGSAYDWIENNVRIGDAPESPSLPALQALLDAYTRHNGG